MGREPDTNELLAVADVAVMLSVDTVTVYRWCRSGRLPCIKLGKEWRIRRATLEAFLSRAEHHVSLAGRLRSFYTVPDHVIAFAETEALLYRAEATFLQQGEALGGFLVKCYPDSEVSADHVRGRLAQAGLDVAGLEVAGRLRLVAERVPPAERGPMLQQLLRDRGDAAEPAWVSFNWTQAVPSQQALALGAELAQLVANSRLVVQTTILERTMADWGVAAQRHLRDLHHGAIWISRTNLALSRVTALPPT